MNSWAPLLGVDFSCLLCLVWMGLFVCGWYVFGGLVCCVVVLVAI